MNKLPNRKKISYTWKSFFNDVSRIKDNYNSSVKHEVVKNIYGIPRGGLILATILSYKLNIPIITDRNKISRKTLVVDDIINTGKTLKFYLKGKNYFDIVSIFRSEGYKADFFTSYSKICGEYETIIFPWEVNNTPDKDNKK
jgi:hypoxanthine phosphoribosyltransferase